MKNIRICSAILVAGVLNSCAAAVKLVNGPQVPAAQGAVTVSGGRNGNTRLQIGVKYLAQPDKVSAGAVTYVAWASSSPDVPPRSLGALKVSKDLTGTLDTVTPLSSFALTITPEQSATVPVPSGPPVLSANIARR